jgi:TonB family protein
MNAKFVKYSFAALIWLVSVFLPVSAQRKPISSQNKCNLQINVYEFKEDGSSEEFPVKDAKITLVNTKTGKSLKISQQSDIPTFMNVAADEYKLTVSKQGFKKTLETFSNECVWLDEQNTRSLIVFLWKGDSKQKVEFGKSGSKGGYYEVKGEKPINNGAVLLVRPVFPRAARAVKAYGAVNVQVTINELGYVISAEAIDGHPLLRSAAVEAAKKSKFRMTFLEGFPVKVTGVIVYNFVP